MPVGVCGRRRGGYEELSKGKRATRKKHQAVGWCLQLDPSLIVRHVHPPPAKMQASIICSVDIPPSLL